MDEQTASSRALGAAGPAAVTETHSSVVFFVGELVCKLKKPVDLGFLDFTTRAARERACHREVELNRRLAPDVYLGVSDVTDPQGEVCDHLVVMRRMPDEARLSTRLDRGEDVEGCVRAVAQQVAALHAQAPDARADPDLAEIGTPQAVAGNWSDGRATLEEYAGSVLPAAEIERVDRLAQRYLAGRHPLLEQRREQGWIRDGHGDLLAQDIFCLSDGPRILDCLDFADHYRVGDTLLDAAFLAMDLERLGHPELAQRFLAWYREFAGDRPPGSLEHHYLAYRAHVRAKVACVRHGQGDESAADPARRLHRLSLDHLEQGRVLLVLVGGVPGAGKSTVARAISDQRGAALLRSDEIRKELAGMPPSSDAAAPYRQGLYAPEQISRVYEELRARARDLLESGVSVVLDASWSSALERGHAAELARSTRSDLVQLRCSVPLEVARARLAARPRGSDPSDATDEVLEAMHRESDPWPQATTIPTGEAIDTVLASVRRAVGAQLDRVGDGDGP